MAIFGRTLWNRTDVLATGDTWWNGYYPFIDNENGGSIDGMIRAANANIAKVTDHTAIVPGHGPIGSKKELIEYRDMLVGVRANVAALKSSGKSRSEAIAAKPTADYDSKWGGFVIDGAFFTRLVGLRWTVAVRFHVFQSQVHDRVAKQSVHYSLELIA